MNTKSSRCVILCTIVLFFLSACGANLNAQGRFQSTPVSSDATKVATETPTVTPTFEPNITPTMTPTPTPTPPPTQIPTVVYARFHAILFKDDLRTADPTKPVQAGEKLLLKVVFANNYWHLVEKENGQKGYLPAEMISILPVTPAPSKIPTPGK